MLSRNRANSIVSVSPEAFKNNAGGLHVTKPYNIRRNTNQNVPVYEVQRSYWLDRRTPDIYNLYNITVVDNITGDIWELRNELTEVILANHDLESVESQVLEICGKVHFLGHYRYCIRDYLVENGF